MKSKKYWHSSVNIKEYEFPKVYLSSYPETEILKFIDIKNKFNSSKDINEKYDLAKQLPKQLFCTCRFCGKLIVNINFNIRYEKNGNYFHVRTPKIWCREINNEKFYLSCCENCLLDHFKDNPPKSNKYYFMKANKYGAYSFGYNEDIYFILELNLCIEFNGTLFHADPRIFKEDDHPNPYIKTITAKELWNKDNERYKKLKELRNIDTIVVWESDYRNGIDIENFIKETLKIKI